MSKISSVKHSPFKKWWGIGLLAATASGAVALPGRAAPLGDGDWIGGGLTPRVPVGAAPMQRQGFRVQTSGKNLLQVPRTVVDAKVSEVSLNAPGLVSEFLWSSDGKLLYVLEKTGILHVIAVPSFIEQKTIDLGQQANYLAVSQEGIVIGLEALQEIWVLDSDKFNIKKRVPLANMNGIAASPKLSNIYVSVGDSDLAIINMRTGQVVSKLSAHQVQREQGDQIIKHPRGVVLSEFSRPRVTPDGKYLLCVGFECIHRFAITGDELRYEEMGPRIGQNAQRLEVSPDSNYVALPSGGGNYPIAERFSQTPYGTYIFRVTDLGNPILLIQSGAYPRVLAFDRRASKIYTQNFENQLLVFTTQGIQEKSYKLSSRGSEPSLIFPHPSGSKMLILADKLYWVELPGS